MTAERLAEIIGFELEGEAGRRNREDWQRMIERCRQQQRQSDRAALAAAKEDK